MGPTNSFDPVVWIVRVRNLGRDLTMTLGKVQMTPRKFFEIMRLARLAAVRTRKRSATIGPKPDLQNMRALARIQPLNKQPSRRRHSQAKPQYPRPSSAPAQTEQRINVLGSLNLSGSNCGVEVP